ncbi:MAG: methyltransferase domain-containing protein [Candidatus Thorarchaeota archaeon]|nr:methyltransferase domain-containing protein [Candidatus Thorarchaeota archaeon]
MTRLDLWLVQNKHFSSRQAAKRAIHQGLVTIDGVKAKPSTQVSGTEGIEVSDTALNFPIGYSKLEFLHRTVSHLITPQTQALDIGSSAGGFLRYLAENCSHVTGIEISDEFMDALQEITQQHDTVSVLIDNAFALDPSIISQQSTLDLLLIDVTTGLEGTIKLIEKYSSLLVSEGWLVAAFKAVPSPNIISDIVNKVENLEFHDVKGIVIQVSRKEFHVVGRRH